MISGVTRGYRGNKRGRWEREFAEINIKNSTLPEIDLKAWHPLFVLAVLPLTTVDFFFFFFMHQPLNYHFWNIPRNTWKKPLKAYLPSSPGKTIAPKCLYKSHQRYPQARQPGLFYPEKKANCIQTGDFHETAYRQVWFCSQHMPPWAWGPLPINTNTQKYNPSKWEQPQ